MEELKQGVDVWQSLITPMPIHVERQVNEKDEEQYIRIESPSTFL